MLSRVSAPWLKRSFGTQVWAYENMPDVLAEPGRYLLGCTNAEPIVVEICQLHVPTSVAQTTLQASSNESRGLRENTFVGSP